MGVKTVYILGAGSSIGHSLVKSSVDGNYISFPTIDEFFKKALEINLYKNNEFKDITEYVDIYFGENVKERNSKIDIENLLTNIEIDIEKNASPKLLSIRQEMLSFIRMLLIKLSEQFLNIDSDYDRFWSNIRRSDTIITFNWDIMLDNIMRRDEESKDSRGNSKTHYSDFKHKFTAPSEKTLSGIQEPYQEWKKEKGYFIKAHGSIDWFYCSNEACRVYRNIFIVDEIEKEQNCSYCHEQLGNLIIPPVLNKGYRKYPLIRTLWNLASKEISIADEIVIWGYSMPPTDFYASWLLRQARRAPLKKLTIINPALLPKASSKPTFRTVFARKYYDIFREQLPKKNLMNSLFLYKNYNDYSLGQDIFEAYRIHEKVEKYNKL